MSISLEKKTTKESGSISIGIFQDNFEKIQRHYHDNYEISFITEGKGRRIVADSIENFQPGDLVFIGPRLPHVWIADSETYSPNSRTMEMVFLQFGADILPLVQLKLPEFEPLGKALSMSERGMRITGDTLNQVSEIMLQLPYLKGFDRMLHLYRILEKIGNSTECIPLASREYFKKNPSTSDRRIKSIHEYLMKHFMEDINLRTLADQIDMAEGSLCRYFRQKLDMTVFEYLARIRIDFACDLLSDIDRSITDVCHDSGFNNISHFNKQFRKYAGMSPSDFRRQLAVKYNK
jgi:AraC-like DNA-binding protein